MDVWNVANTISGMIGTFLGLIGTIISFITMKKAVSIEKKMNVQKNIRAFNVQYKSLMSQIRLLLEQLSQNDLDNTVLSSTLDIISNVKHLANGGEWDKADVILIDQYYSEFHNSFENNKVIVSEESSKRRLSLCSRLEEALITIKNILDKVANLNDIR